MNGQPDQVYLPSHVLHVVVDTKTRRSIATYKTDVVQLSVYKVILENNGYKMASYGYVRVVTPSDVQFIKKKLLTQEQVIHEYDKTVAIRQGIRRPRFAPHKSMCLSCGQKRNCSNS